MIFTSGNEISMQVQVLKAHPARLGMPDDERTPFDTALQTTVDVSVTFQTEASAIQRNPNYTAIGKRSTIDALAKRCDALLAPVRTYLAAVSKTAADLRAAAVRGLVPSPAGGYVFRDEAAKAHANDVAMLMRHREIRDLARQGGSGGYVEGVVMVSGADQTTGMEAPGGRQLRGQADDAYLNAVYAGDEDTAVALENAPKSFPLIGDEARRLADEFRIKNSPNYEALVRVDYAREAVSTVLGDLDRMLLVARDRAELEVIAGGGTL